MNLPPRIKKPADEAFAIVARKKDHEFGPKARGALFSKWLVIDEKAAKKAICWIGILCAKHVLPLFEDVMWSRPKSHWDGLDLLPYKSIVMAEGVMAGVTDADYAYEYACGSHYDVEIMQPDLPLYAHLANRAANLALTAASDPTGWYDPFNVLTKLAFENNNITDIESVGTLDYMTWETFTDAIWSMSTDCDVSSAAATAWSCIDDLYIADSVRLFDFWTWWFQVALPEAWMRASISI